MTTKLRESEAIPGQTVLQLLPSESLCTSAPQSQLILILVECTKYHCAHHQGPTWNISRQLNFDILKAILGDNNVKAIALGAETRSYVKIPRVIHPTRKLEEP